VNATDVGIVNHVGKKNIWSLLGHLQEMKLKKLVYDRKPPSKVVTV